MMCEKSHNCPRTFATHFSNSRRHGGSSLNLDERATEDAPLGLESRVERGTRDSKVRRDEPPV